MNYQETKDKLDKIGCGMCLAKWTQVTIHLQNGHTHSCHHPRTHKIPLTELKDNPSALHNTNYKKRQRRTMRIRVKKKRIPIIILSYDYYLIYNKNLK